MRRMRAHHLGSERKRSLTWWAGAHGQAWRRMVTRCVPNRGKGALVTAGRPAACGSSDWLPDRTPSLSHQLNRVILQSCGRAVIHARLAVLRDRFGILFRERQPQPACCPAAASSSTARRIGGASFIMTHRLFLHDLELTIDLHDGAAWLHKLFYPTNVFCLKDL